MNKNFYIDAKNIRKVYPRKLGEQLTSLLLATLGRKDTNAKGGVALANLNLSIYKGERLGIIGRNGAGKSTLLQLLAGITEPTSGQLFISGKVTAILTLGAGLRDDLSGRENIYLDGEAQGKSRKETAEFVEQIIEFSELEKFIDQPLRTYSTGMKARLAFAMITQINPEILIIDEALSVGDASFSIKASKRISELCSNGAIVIIVSHSMQSILELCNRCLWLDSGKLVMDGHPEIVTNAYLESVKYSNELDFLPHHLESIGARSYVEGYKVEEISRIPKNLKLIRITSGDPLTLEYKWHTPEMKPLGQFLIRLIRHDGSLIFEQRIPLADLHTKSRLRATFPRLNLAPSLYCLQLEWTDFCDTKYADTNTAIEVIATETPSGGRPVLLDVGHIDSIYVGKKE